MHLISRLQTALWLIGVSGCVFAGLRLGLWSLRLKLVMAGVAMLPRLDSFRHAPRYDGLRRALEERPEIIGALVWPYVDSRWSARARMEALAQHFAALDQPRRQLLAFAASESVEIARLPSDAECYRLVLDKPSWFIREGQVALNLFREERRLYSLVFSMGVRDGEEVCYVGAIQGVAGDDVQEIYRTLTKRLYGMRPRDLLIETLRVCCDAMGVDQLLFVADQHRHQRAGHYFDTAQLPTLTNYDAIWIDRGACLRGDGFFALPARHGPRNLNSVPSNKRSMYRKRGELTDELFRNVTLRFGAAAAGR